MKSQAALHMVMRAVQFFLGTAILGVSTAMGTDWAPMLNTEIYDRSKWIVIGTLDPEGEGADLKWTIRVEEMVKGDRVAKLSVVPNKLGLGPVDESDARLLFCVGEFEGRRYLFHPSCVRAAAEGRVQMEAARKLLADPKAVILNADLPPNPEVLYVIRTRFAPEDDPTKQPVSRKEAVAYIKRSLQMQEPEAMLETLKTMRRIRDTSLEADVRKLLTTETPAWAVHDMVYYLKETKAPEAIQHLEALLRVTAPKYPAQHKISDTCAEALGQLGKPESVAALEAAARHGVQRAIEALIIHGTVDSFDMLFETYQAAVDSGSQPNALHWFVRRSNRPVEAWMHPTTYSTDRGRAMKAKWNDWRKMQYAQHGRHLVERGIGFNEFCNWAIRVEI